MTWYALEKQRWMIVKKPEMKNEVLYVRVSKSIKDFITGLALKRYGGKRKESILVNEILEDIRDFGKCNIREGKEL